MSRFLRLAGVVGLAYLAACVAVWISDELTWVRFQRRALEVRHEGE